MHNAQSFTVAIPAKPRGAPQLLLQLGFLRAFSRELVDAGFPIAVFLAVSGGGSLFVCWDGWVWSLQYILGGCEDGLPVLEHGEGDVFSFAVCDEV